VFFWRISNHVSLAGEGGLRASGRWHTRGRRVVYCSESPAAALLETLVHFEIELRDLPVRYRLLRIEAPDDVLMERVLLEELPRDWPDKLDMTRPIGDRWLEHGTTAMLRVPSVLVPETFNVLLNPAHQDATRIALAHVSEQVIDPRLLK
jgi:RES domain-containing protein